jgi:hypothetical protein
MLRASLIGPGDIEFHCNSILEMSVTQFRKHIKGIARVLSELDIELELLPDKGFCLELAREYKREGGKSVIGSVPQDEPGRIKHLEQYMKERGLFNDFINTGNWKNQNRIKGLLGDFQFIMGLAPGTEIESNYASYLINLMKGKVKDVHPEIRIGRIIRPTYIVYSPFIKQKRLIPEAEAYLRKYKINLIYIKSPQDLRKTLSSLLAKSQH